MSTCTDDNPPSDEHQISSDDFVHVLPGDSFGSDKIKEFEASNEKNDDTTTKCESHREMAEMLIAVRQENEKLKETLAQNNMIFQQNVQKFMEMQEAHKVTDENVRKEQQRVKNIIMKLREDNHALKLELKSMHSQIGYEVMKGNLEDLENENQLMKEQIKALQEHIQKIDIELKDTEISDNIADTWQQLLGSMASYNFKSGIAQSNVESLDKEINAAKQCQNTDDDKKQHEVQQEILKVDLEKVKVEKTRLEGELANKNEELTSLKEHFCHLKKENEKIRKMLDEECTLNLERGKENQKISDLMKATQVENKKFQEELKTLKSALAEARDAIMQQNMDSQDDVHDICKEKLLAMKNQYFNLEKRVNNMEERENSLCAKEREFEEKEKRQQQENENLKKKFEAELESRYNSFVEKSNQLHSELQQAREREESLQKHLDQKSLDNSEKEENLRLQVCQLIDENDTMRTDIGQLVIQNSRRKELLMEVEKKKNEKEKENFGVIEMLKGQLGSSRNENKTLNEQNDFLRTDLERIRVQHDQLIKEYDELLNSYNGTLEDNQKRKSSRCAEIESFKGEMDDLAIRATAAHEACEKKDAVIVDLRNKLSATQSETAEGMSVLKEQMDVYYNDFKAEREARERQHEDIMTLKEQNQLLIERNRDLERQLDLLTNDQQIMEEMQRRHGSRPPSVTDPQAFLQGYQTRRNDLPVEQQAEGFVPRGQRQDPVEEMNCPVCDRGFWDFDALQQHVVECLPEANRERVNDNQCPLCGNEFPDPDTLEIHAQECLDRDAALS